MSQSTFFRDILDSDTIIVGATVNDWKEAIHRAALPLEAKGWITENYPRQIIRLVESLGPYIVVAPGIAFAHARPEHGVNRLCMSLLTLAKPVTFGSEVNDPVQIVVVFGAERDSSHLDLLHQLAQFFSDGNNVQELLAARTPAEVLEAIRRRILSRPS